MSLLQYLIENEPFKNHTYNIEKPRKGCIIITKVSPKTPWCPEVKLLGTELEQENNSIKALSSELVLLDKNYTQTIP